MALWDHQTELEVAGIRTTEPSVFVAGDLVSNFIDLDLDGLTASLVPGTVTPANDSGDSDYFYTQATLSF